MDTTALIIIGSVLSIGMFVLGILTFSNNRNKNNSDQAVETAKLEVKLTAIESQLTEIKAILCTSNERYQTLEKRVFILEQRKKEM